MSAIWSAAKRPIYRRNNSESIISESRRRRRSITRVRARWWLTVVIVATERESKRIACSRMRPGDPTFASRKNRLRQQIAHRREKRNAEDVLTLTTSSRVGLLLLVVQTTSAYTGSMITASCQPSSPDRPSQNTRARTNAARNRPSHVSLNRFTVQQSHSGRWPGVASSSSSRDHCSARGESVGENVLAGVFSRRLTNRGRRPPPSTSPCAAPAGRALRGFTPRYTRRRASSSRARAFSRGLAFPRAAWPTGTRRRKTRDDESRGEIRVARLREGEREIGTTNATATTVAWYRFVAVESRRVAAQRARELFLRFLSLPPPWCVYLSAARTRYAAQVSA